LSRLCAATHELVPKSDRYESKETKKMIRNGFWIGVALFAVGTAARADVSAIVKDCEGCHGNDGVSSSSDVPTIAGISAGVHGDYLLTYQEKKRPCVKSAYRQGDTARPAVDMCEVTAKLSADEIEQVAAHFAAKPFKHATQTADATKAAAGAKIHARDCEKCHTEKGSDAEADASILAGQWMPYLKQAFEEFKSGKRPESKKMQEKTGKLTAADLDALINFYGSQQ
jgi:sulfide dehydrogenase cytochrome subunit